jgi:hypothetical protein
VNLGVGVKAALTDNGSEWIAGGFRAHLTTSALSHHRILPAHRTTTPCASGSRAPFSRSAGDPPSDRRRFTSIRQRQAEADEWLVRYHHRRRNHADYMRDRTPAEILENHRPPRAS